MQDGQLFDLFSAGAEICRIEPGFKRTLASRPLVVKHGEPGGVTIAPLDYHVLAEDSFEGKTEAECGPSAGLVFGVALPLVAAIAETFKDVARHQVHGFRRGTGALQGRGEQDVAYFDYAVGRLDAHVAGVPGSGGRV